jgi:hypothetical protein
VKNSSNVLRRTALIVLALGLAAAALGFHFTLNDTGSGMTGLPIKWPPGPIAVRIMLGDTAQFDGSSFNTSARTAAQTWNGVMGSAQIQTTFGTGTPGESNNVNEMAFSATIYGRAFGENVLAVTLGSRIGNERTEADILFNNEETWNSYRGVRPGSLSAGTIDLQRVAIHELGHLLGLDHPDEAVPAQFVSAIMNSRVGSVDTITPDDTEGARALYGPPGVPSNDNFANAADISLGGNQIVTVRGHNTNATKEANDPRQGDNPGGRSVWWRWIAPSSAEVVLDTGKENTVSGTTDVSEGKSSYFDTTLGVYTGTSLAGLTQLRQNDDINPGVVQISRVTFAATAGTTYHICVDGYNAVEQFPTETNGADSGGITLNLAFAGVLGSLPTITAQPASVTVTVGSNTSFSVSATGTALAYQWHFNSSPIPNSTSNTHSVISATSANAGTYHVVVSNQAGSVASNNATLTVNAAPAPTPPPSGGGGGGGGAPSLWLYAGLAALGLARFWHRPRPE